MRVIGLFLLRMGFFGVTWVCFPDVTSTLRTWECCNHSMSDSDYVRYFASSLFAISTTYKFREGKGEGRGMRVQTLRNRRTRCSWIGLHFHDSIDFYGVAFSAIFNSYWNGVTHFWDFRRKKIMASKDSFRRKIHGQKSCYHILIFNKRLQIHSGLAQKRTKTGSITGHNIGWNTAEALRG